jgi:ATP adenylyltransferase
MEYIESTHDDDGCFLCQKQDLPDEDGLILARTELSVVLLNAYPYNPGHLLVAPKRHVGDLQSLSTEESTDLSEAVRRAVRGLGEGVEPDGFNVGLNLGRVAGAGVPDHLHWHVVPRWSGDTNFMAVVGVTRVLPELLAETWSKLRTRF